MYKDDKGFLSREVIGNSYWKDARWEEVNALREQGKQMEANGLVSEIRVSWGV